MKITAALSWYNEPPDMLDKVVRSCQNIADRIVAVDGSYVRYPNGKPSSPPEQARAIREAAEAVGLECLVLTADRQWIGEEEKRTVLLQLAAQGSDWVAVIDADTLIVCDRDRTRAYIAAHAEVDAWSVDLFTPLNPKRGLDKSAIGVWHKMHAGESTPFVHLFRAYPGLAVERFHWWHSAVKGGQRVWLEYGGNDYAVPDGRPLMANPHLPDYRVDHLTLFRDDATIAERKAYYAEQALMVELSGQEQHYPGAPTPLWKGDGLTVTAALAWYDEPIETLEACVRSCAVVADRIVAFDGAYARWPNGRVASPPGQAEAIRGVAEELGLECKVLIPDELWAGQVAKRSAMLAEASRDSDWVLQVDADHVLSGDRVKIRADLKAATVDVFDAPMLTPANPERPLLDSASHSWHANLSGQTIGVPTVYRALPGLRCADYHWMIAAEKNGRTIYLQGDQSTPHGNLGSLSIEHRCLVRDKDHVLANRAFCNDREMVVRLTGQEDDRPDLPRPVYEFDRLGGPVAEVAAAMRLAGAT